MNSDITGKTGMYDNLESGKSILMLNKNFQNRTFLITKEKFLNCEIHLVVDEIWCILFTSIFIYLTPVWVWRNLGTPSILISGEAQSSENKN